MFTKREEEVVHLLLQGLSNKDIAEKMIISKHTVKAHLESIYEKLGVNNRIQAVINLMNQNK